MRWKQAARGGVAWHQPFDVVPDARREGRIGEGFIGVEAERLRAAVDAAWIVARLVAGGSMRFWVWVAVGVTLVTAPCVRHAEAQQRIIYDDDCSNDVDCVATLPILYQLEDR